MSLLIACVFERFCVVASDGLAVKPTAQGIVPIGTDYCKFQILGDGDIAVGGIGSLVKNRAISDFCKTLEEQHRGDPELFSILERAIPEEVRRLTEQTPTTIHVDETGESLNFGGVTHY
jgi:hypothetical protein